MKKIISIPVSKIIAVLILGSTALDLRAEGTNAPSALDKAREEFVHRPDYDSNLYRFQAAMRRVKQSKAACAAYDNLWAAEGETLDAEPLDVKVIHAMYQQLGNPRTKTPEEVESDRLFLVRTQAGVQTPVGYQAQSTRLRYLKVLLRSYDSPKIVKARKDYRKCILAEIQRDDVAIYPFAKRMMELLPGEDEGRRDQQNLVAGLAAELQKANAPVASNTNATKPNATIPTEQEQAATLKRIAERRAAYEKQVAHAQAYHVPVATNTSAAKP